MEPESSAPWPANLPRRHPAPRLPDLPMTDLPQPNPAEPCPLVNCMELLGGAWTPNIIWHLSAGPRRFSHLKRELSPISAKVLAARLRRMVDDGLVTRQVTPSSPPAVSYDLTDLGRELKPAIAAIVDVGLKLQERARAAEERAQRILRGD